MKTSKLNYSRHLKKNDIINNVEILLTNFTNKYGVGTTCDIDTGELNQEYAFLPVGVVADRNDLDSLWAEMKENFSEFWHGKEDKRPYFVQGLPVFEMVNDYMKLSGAGQLIAKKTSMDYSLQKETLPLTSSSLALVDNDRISLPSYFMSDEANVWSHYLHFAGNMDAFWREQGIVHDLKLEQHLTNQDVLRGAYAAIAYGTYIAVNNLAENKHFGSSEVINKELFKEPQLGIKNVLEMAKEAYDAHLFKQPKVIIGGVVD